jgi:transcriptional regulator with XRE-family HTH domain
MKNNFYEEVGKKIQLFRKRNKMSQKELAKGIGKASSTYVNLIESGKRRVSLESLINISATFNTDLISLLEHHHKDLRTAPLLELALDCDPHLSTENKAMLLHLIHFLKKNGS